jgi:hypothetical protein
VEVEAVEDEFLYVSVEGHGPNLNLNRDSMHVLITKSYLQFSQRIR